MKLITLNIHGYERGESAQEHRRRIGQTAREILRERPDVLALQECTQMHEGSRVAGAVPGFAAPVDLDAGPGVVTPPLREGNTALELAELLRAQDASWSFSWVGAKIGYEVCDEGLALFTRLPILEAQTFYLSALRDYASWRCRRALQVRTAQGLFVCVHLGWWDDEKEPAAGQIERLCRRVERRGSTFLLGDFNADATVRGEGYDLLLSSGWQDTYALARERDAGLTALGEIDGWAGARGGRRIDYIFSGEKRAVQSSLVIFDGKDSPVVSDHFGVRAVVL